MQLNVCHEIDYRMRTLQAWEDGIGIVGVIHTLAIMGQWWSPWWGRADYADPHMSETSSRDGQYIMLLLRPIDP